MLRFSSLGSGSSGNATLVEAWPDDADGPPTRLLVDCGLGPRRLAQALTLRGCGPSDLDAVFVTHEHSDHVGGVLALHRRHRTRVITSAGTWAAACARAGTGEKADTLADGDTVQVGRLTIQPFAVPHDAAEPLQLVLSDGRHRMGVLTDLGEPTDAVARALQGCDALLLECNHDVRMLADGPYPAWLKRRIGGRRGHLSNDQSAEMLDACLHDALRHVVAAHLSQQNNAPDLALAALRGALGQGLPFARPELHVADAAEGCGWITLD